MKISQMIHGVVLLIAAFNLMAVVNAALAAPTKPPPPTRDPNTPGYVAAKELPDGTNPAADTDGNFIIGSTHKLAPEMTVQAGVPQGTVYNTAALPLS